ncbi:hypothetical protein Tco_1000300 [Tanacetum coccineum]
MISKINLLWKSGFEKLDDTPIRDTTGNPAAQINFMSTNDPTREKLQGKGIKAHQSYSLQNICLNEAKEDGNVKTSTTEYEDHEMTVESEKEFEEETEEEEEENNPKHFDTFPTMKELRYCTMLTVVILLRIMVIYGYL